MKTQTTNIEWLTQKTQTLLSTARTLRMAEISGNSQLKEHCSKLIQGTPEYHREAVYAVKDALEPATSIERFGMYIQENTGERREWMLAAILPYDSDTDEDFPETDVTYATREEAEAAQVSGREYQVMEYHPDLMYSICDKDDNQVGDMKFPTFARALVFMMKKAECAEWDAFIMKEELAVDEDESTSFHRTEFQNLLRRAIGELKKNEFAVKIGITPQYLSNLLNNANSSRPSTDLLVRIAKASSAVTIEELYQSCGYVKESAPAIEGSYDELPTKEWVKANLKMTRAYYVECLSGKHGKFTAEQEEDIINMLYRDGGNRIVVTLGPAEPNRDKTKYYEEARLMQVKWTHGTGVLHRGTMVLDIVIFGHTSSSGVWYIENCSYTPSEIAKALPERHSYYSNVNDIYVEDGLDVFDAPMFYEYTANKEYKEVEKRILDAIFGSKKIPEGERIETAVVNGPGFKTDDITEEMFLNFLRNHRKSFEVSATRKEFCRIVLDEGGDINDACENFLTYDEDTSKIQTTCEVVRMNDIIADIIERESGVKGVQYWESDPDNKEDQKYHNYSSIIVDDHYVQDVEIDHILDVLICYAKELELHEVRWCFYYMDTRSDEFGIHPIRF